MKKVLLALVGAFALVGVLCLSGTAYAEWSPVVSVAPVYRTSDNPNLEDGVGGSLELSQDIGDGLTASVEVNQVSQDAVFGKVAIGELRTTSLFGNVKYDVLRHAKVNLNIGGGIGFISPELDSNIPSISFDVDNTLALKVLAEWTWNVHKGDNSGSWWESVDMDAFGQVAYIVADSDLKITSDGSPTFTIGEQDLDSTDVKAGITIKM